MNTWDIAVRFVVGFLIGPFWDPDLTLKAERVQFWRSIIHPSWTTEGAFKALLRTVICRNAEVAAEHAKILAGELARYGYKADRIDVSEDILQIRLTTANAGQLTERDYAAAALIDLNS